MSGYLIKAKRIMGNIITWSFLRDLRLQLDKGKTMFWKCVFTKYVERIKLKYSMGDRLWEWVCLWLSCLLWGIFSLWWVVMSNINMIGFVLSYFFCHVCLLCPRSLFFSIERQKWVDLEERWGEAGRVMGGEIIIRTYCMIKIYFQPGHGGIYL